MSKENKEFLKKVFILALPMVIQGLMDSGIQIMDTLMIGSLGTESIAGVGIANQIFFVYILIIVGIGSGCSIFISQYYGSNNYENIKKIVGIGLISSVAVGLLFLCVIGIMPEKILNLYSNDLEVIQIGVDYIKVVSPIYLLTAISFILHTSIKSIQQPKYSTIITFITLISNTVLNYVFIFVFDMGVVGAGTATVIARTIEVLALILIIYKNDFIISGKIKEYFSFDMSLIKLYYSKAGFVILNELAWATGVSTYMMSYGIVGTEGQAAAQISNNVANLFMVTSIAIGTSCCIMLADLLGAKEIQKARRYAKKFVVTGLIFISIMSLLFVLSTPIIVRLFMAEPEVAISVYKINYFLSIIIVAKTFNYIGIVGILRSGGDTLFATLIDFVFVWFVGVPLSFIGAKYLGFPIHIVVLLAGMEELCKIPVVYYRIRSDKWSNTLV